MSYKARLEAIAQKPARTMLDRKLSNERRWALRKSGLLAGQIYSDRMQGAAGCIVRDLSATGAKLEIRSDRGSVVMTTSAIPDSFILVIENESIEVSCAVVWRDHRDIGVRFISPMKHLPKRPKRPIAKKAVARR